MIVAEKASFNNTWYTTDFTFPTRPSECEKLIEEIEKRVNSGLTITFSESLDDFKKAISETEDIQIK